MAWSQWATAMAVVVQWKATGRRDHDAGHKIAVDGGAMGGITAGHPRQGREMG